MKKNYSKYFIILLVINIVCLLSSNIVSSKPVDFGILVFTAGDFLFPVTYILNDLFVEVYGYKASKFTIRISFIANIIMILIFLLAIIMPYPNYYSDQLAFQKILSFTPRLLLASMLAYYFGNISNSFIMSKLKQKNEKQKVWIRTILSSIVGEVIDTTIFIVIAFLGVMTFAELIKMIISIYFLKLFIEIVFTPILVVIIDRFKKLEGV